MDIGILSLQRDSIFARRYRDGMSKADLWEPLLDDTMLLLGRLPLVAAYVYRRSYKDGRHVAPAARELDWAANLAHMLGVDRPQFRELMRLYLGTLYDAGLDAAAIRQTVAVNPARALGLEPPA